jgi:TPR repeat protein
MYENGWAVRRDFTAAVKWYGKAAEKGESGAQVDLGRMFAHGLGVSRDYTEAVKWFRKAAVNRRDARAQYHLGFMYAAGLGVPRDLDQAIHWFQKAARQGFAYANVYLGLLYAARRGLFGRADLDALRSRAGAPEVVEYCERRWCVPGRRPDR